MSRNNLNKTDRVVFTNLLIERIINNIDNIIIPEDNYEYVMLDSFAVGEEKECKQVYDTLCEQAHSVSKEVIRDMSTPKDTIFLSDYIPMLRLLYDKLISIKCEHNDDIFYLCVIISDSEYEVNNNLSEKFEYPVNILDLEKWKINTALVCGYVEAVKEFCTNSSYHKYKDWLTKFDTKLDNVRDSCKWTLSEKLDYQNWTIVYPSAVVVAAGLAEVGHDRRPLITVLSELMKDYIKLTNAYSNYLLNLEKCGGDQKDLKLSDYFYILCNLDRFSKDDCEDCDSLDQEELDENDTLDISQLEKEYDLSDENSDEDNNSDGETYAEGCQDDISEKDDDDKVDIDEELKKKHEEFFNIDPEKEKAALANLTKKIKKKEVERVKGITKNYFKNCKEREKFNSTTETIDYKMVANYHNIMTTSNYDFNGHHSIKFDNLSEKQYKTVIKSLITIIKKGIQ